MDSESLEILYAAATVAGNAVRRLERENMQLRGVVHAAKRLLANYYEFGTITDGEFIDDLERALAEIPVSE